MTKNNKQEPELLKEFIGAFGALFGLNFLQSILGKAEQGEDPEFEEWLAAQRNMTPVFQQIKDMEQEDLNNPKKRDEFMKAMDSMPNEIKQAAAAQFAKEAGEQVNDVQERLSVFIETLKGADLSGVVKATGASAQVVQQVYEPYAKAASSQLTKLWGAFVAALDKARSQKKMNDATAETLDVRELNEAFAVMLEAAKDDPFFATGHDFGDDPFESPTARHERTLGYNPYASHDREDLTARDRGAKKPAGGSDKGDSGGGDSGGGDSGGDKGTEPDHWAQAWADSVKISETYKSLAQELKTLKGFAVDKSSVLGIGTVPAGEFIENMNAVLEQVSTLILQRFPNDLASKVGKSDLKRKGFSDGKKKEKIQEHRAHHLFYESFGDFS